MKRIMLLAFLFSSFAHAQVFTGYQAGQYFGQQFQIQDQCSGPIQTYYYGQIICYRDCRHAEWFVQQAGQYGRVWNGFNWVFAYDYRYWWSFRWINLRARCF